MIKMFFNYLFYIIKHKWYVMIECFERGLIWRGLIHDLSKFLPDEFFPYMLWFYGKYGIRFKKNCYGMNGPQRIKFNKTEKTFNIAWLKHIHRNKHHYQYWYLRNDDGTEEYLEITDKYKKEMLCDWIGAGKAITGKNNIKKWWNDTKDKKKMNKSTFKWLDDQIRSIN